MRKILLLIFIITASVAYNQDLPDYHYQFKLDGVTTLGDAKYATDVFRHKFEVFPTFDDVNDRFDFISITYIDESELGAVLTPQGYVIIEFIRTEVQEVPDEK